MNGILVKILERQEFPRGQQQLQLYLGNLQSGTYILTMQQQNSLSRIKFMVKK
jgi:hypothetical protein